MFMIKNISHKFNQIRLTRKWRKRKSRGRNISLRANNVLSLLRDFEQHGIKYVVLRWFDEVPLTAEEEASFPADHDIDILIDTKNAKKIASAACKYPGSIKCDIYNLTGNRGLAYNNLPYYPPVLAAKLLDNRIKYRDMFYVPDPRMYFNSLAYHLVYHKGLNSGIASGVNGLQSNPQPKRDYAALLEELGDKINMGLKRPYTLLSLHKYLKENKWDMPYDLLERWPVETQWHNYLLRKHTEALKPWADKLPGLIVFFIRQDIVELGKTDDVYDMLEERFEIVLKQELTQQQIADVSIGVRGGNWTGDIPNKIVVAAIAVVCYDHNPRAVSETDRKRLALYPKVSNQNVFHKHEIRDRLDRDRSIPKRISSGIHCSDNPLEAQNMLQALFPETYQAVNQKILDGIT